MDRAKAMVYIEDINDVLVMDDEYEAKRKAVPRSYFKSSDTEYVWWPNFTMIFVNKIDLMVFYLLPSFR